MGEPIADLTPSQYTIQEQWHSQPAHIRVICVGAGAAGLLVAYKLQKNLTDYELVCYDKNPAIGGTWFENRYPGCACDVPAHVYTYPFDQNPDWSSFYAYSSEIRQYFENFAGKHDLHKFVKLNTRVINATWDEEKGIYDVEVESEGKRIKDWCHILINGTGYLNDWKWPDIEGLKDFGGTMLHSANWDPSVDYAGKNIALIGTGSSAIQILPQIQKTGNHITAFMRSVTWISPPVAGEILEATKQSSTDKSAQSKPEAQYFYTEEEKKRFRDDPQSLLQYRKDLEVTFNAMAEIFIKDSDVSKQTEKVLKAEMERRIGPGHEELKKKLIPTWAPGCRRLTPGDGYLEALVQPNVTPVHKEIRKIVPEGVIDELGQLHKVDILICATGFNLAFAPPFTVKGVQGVDMKTEFGNEPKVYLGLTVPKFPNFFAVNGVRGNWAAGTVLVTHDIQVDYILSCIDRIQKEGIKALEVKMEPIEQLYQHIDEWHKRSVWSDNCKSWYKGNVIGGKLWIWGGSGLHYNKTIKVVRWEHYSFRYKTNNMWSFLGNGMTEAQVKKDMARLAPYIRLEDTPFEI